MRDKKPYTIRLYIDTVEELKSQGIQIAPYIRDLLDNHIESIDEKNKRKKQLEKKLNKIKKSIKLQKEAEKKEREKYKNISKEKEEHIQETIRIIQKNPGFLNGRRMHYNNTFVENLTKKQFKKLLKKNRKTNKENSNKDE